jgi:hypothetical protein
VVTAERWFEDDADRKGFLFRLAKVCASHGWRVHAWVLMNHHFHLLVGNGTAKKLLSR